MWDVRCKQVRKLKYEVPVFWMAAGGERAKFNKQYIFTAHKKVRSNFILLRTSVESFPKIKTLNLGLRNSYLLHTSITAFA